MSRFVSLDDVLDGIELSTGSISNSTHTEPFNTGVLSLDLMCFAGISGGIFVTTFGKEQSGKSTIANEVMAYRTAELYYARMEFADAEAGAYFKPALVIYDYEGSFDFTPNGLFMNTLRKHLPGITCDAVFGVRGPKGEWEIPPLIRFHKLSKMEVFFDTLHALGQHLPDVTYLNGKNYAVYDPKENKEFESFKKYANTDLLKRTKKYWCELPAGMTIPYQVLMVADSYPAMLPAAADEDEANKQMALLAREFAKHIPRVRGAFRTKRITTFGVNQFRERPGFNMGCFQYGAKVLLADGTAKPIGEIVETKYAGLVACKNFDTGVVEHKPVVNWFVNGECNRWVQLRLVSAADPTQTTELPPVTLNHVIPVVRISDGAEMELQVAVILSDYGNYKVHSTLGWQFVSGFKLDGDANATKYDIEVADLHNYCVLTTDEQYGTGVFVHNSPDYEPCGSALRFASDLRLRASALSPQSVGDKPIAAGSNLVKEPSVLFDEQDDQYSYIKLVTAKNKLGGLDKISVTLRLWRSNGKDMGLGIDPVYDTFTTMKMLGMIDPKSTRNRLKFVNCYGLEHATKPMTWEMFKILCLVPMVDLEQDVGWVYDQVGLGQLEPFDIRYELGQGIIDGSLVERFRHHMLGFVTKEETEVVASDEGATYEGLEKED